MRTVVLQIDVGARGRTWLRILRELDVPVAACVDPSPEAAAWVRDEVPDTPVYRDLADALNAHRDGTLAVVVTPPMGRADVLLPMVDAGLHVISEKPLETDLAQAVRVVEAAEARGRHLSVCLNFRFLPVTQALRIQLDGRWGAPTSVTFLYHINRDGRRLGINRFPLDMDDPMLLEQSIHHLDLLRYVYGAEVVRVHGVTFNPPGSMYHGDATVVALLEMSNGLRVTYAGSWVTGSTLRLFVWRTDCEGGLITQRALFGDLEAGPVDGRAFPAWRSC